MRIWNWMMLTRILRVTDSFNDDPAGLDRHMAEFEGPALNVARILSYAMYPYRMRLPERDDWLLEAARQYGITGDPTPGARVPGMLLVRADGGLALALDRDRTIESAGTFMVIVNSPEADRYVAAYEVPGVIYMGGRV